MTVLIRLWQERQHRQIRLLLAQPLCGVATGAEIDGLVKVRQCGGPQTPMQGDATVTQKGSGGFDGRTTT